MKDFHHPLTKRSKLRVSVEFLLHWRSIVNLRSYTSSCADCGSLIDAPDLDDYFVWVPALHGLVMGTSFVIDASGYIRWYHTLLTGVLLIINGWIIPSQIMAFGKWKKPSLGSMSESEYRLYKVDILKKRRRSKPYIIKAVISGILCALFFFGGVYLM